MVVGKLLSLTQITMVLIITYVGSELKKATFGLLLSCFNQFLMNKELCTGFNLNL